MMKKHPKIMKKGEAPGRAARIRLKCKGKKIKVDGLKMKRRPKKMAPVPWEVVTDNTIRADRPMKRPIRRR